MKDKFYLYVRNEKNRRLLIVGDFLYLFLEMKMIFILELVCKLNFFKTGSGQFGFGCSLCGGGKGKEEFIDGIKFYLF